MKTLDEVIEELQYWDTCDEYPESFYDDEVIRDALQYLKWYKELADDSEAFAEWKQNPPLTWDELKQMEGKPVWVEADDGKYKGWVTVGKFYSLFENENLDAHVDLYYFGRSMEYSKEMYGYYWQAYRKERK